MMINVPRLDEVPIGMRVRLRQQGAWYDGLTGVVIGMPRSAMYTVETDDPRQPRALVHVDDIRVIRQ